jgi:hypothetical protein
VVERLQHGDARMHDEVPALGGVDQLRRCELPMWRVVNLLRQRHDVVGGILEREKGLSLRNRNRAGIGSAKRVDHGTSDNPNARLFRR